MKILRSEHRRRVSGDLDYCIGLLQNVRKVVFKGYNTSRLTSNIDWAIYGIIQAKTWIPYTKYKKEKK